MSGAEEVWNEGQITQPLGHRPLRELEREENYKIMKCSVLGIILNLICMLRFWTGKILENSVKFVCNNRLQKLNNYVAKVEYNLIIGQINILQHKL